MLRMSKLTDYGTIVLAFLARDPNHRHTAADVASHTHLALPTVKKLLKALTKANLVTSHRGSHGGYHLSRDAELINAAQIIDALEGPIAITECSGDHSLCSIEAVCGLSSKWRPINIAIHRALEDIKLTHLADPAPGLTVDFRPIVSSSTQYDIH